MFKKWSLTLLCVLFCTLSQAQVQYKKPVVYLTFDDGPSSDGVTELILDVLARHNAKATFFVTGARARANPEKIRQILDGGHALGNHTLSHGRLTSLFDHQVAQELIDTNTYILAAGGPIMNCFRAPFGDTNRRVNDIALRLGLRKVGWTIDTRDWDVFVDPEQIAVQLEDSQNQSIVLMHDGPKSRWRTLQVFSRWMEDTGHTYSFEALPDCAQPVIESYASNDLPPRTESVASTIKTAVPSPVVVQTIPQLLAKLKAYKISLLPEVVAQSSIKSSNQF